MPADLFLYAIIAAGLIFWLRSILGTRDGDERERPNPISALEEKKAAGENGGVIKPQRADDGLSADQRVRDLKDNPARGMSIENDSALEGLLDICETDKDFDVKDFLQKAQDAFAVIVESFADGDKELLADMLSPPVYSAFEAAINERAQKGEKYEAQIHAISSAEILAARVEKKIAYITVRFVANESSIGRDKDGKILYGHPDKATQKRDVWTFGRNMNGRDPRWLVFETRSDVGEGQEDHDLIPNAE